MKKIIAICLLFVMALSLCACGNKNLEARFIGVWQTADGTATLTLNADGTATFEDTSDSANAGSYKFLWVATNNSSITIKWDGEPIPAENTTEEAAPVEETAAAVEATEGSANGSTTTRRDDPSVVGYGSMTVHMGEMLLALNEGSSTDKPLFVYNANNGKTLTKIS